MFFSSPRNKTGRPRRAPRHALRRLARQRLRGARQGDGAPGVARREEEGEEEEDEREGLVSSSPFFRRHRRRRPGRLRRLPRPRVLGAARAAAVRPRRRPRGEGHRRFRAALRRPLRRGCLRGAPAGVWRTGVRREAVAGAVARGRRRRRRRGVWKRKRRKRKRKRRFSCAAAVDVSAARAARARGGGSADGDEAAEGRRGGCLRLRRRFQRTRGGAAGGGTSSSPSSVAFQGGSGDDERRQRNGWTAAFFLHRSFFFFLLLLFLFDEPPRRRGTRWGSCGRRPGGAGPREGGQQERLKRGVEQATLFNFFSFVFELFQKLFRTEPVSPPLFCFYRNNLSITSSIIVLFLVLSFRGMGPHNANRKKRKSSVPSVDAPNGVVLVVSFFFFR